MGVVKRLLHTKILPEINEEKVDKVVKNDALEVRKEKLKEIRGLHQPIRKDFLDDREAKYEELKQQKLLIREQKAAERAKLKFHASYESENYHKAKEENMHRKHFKEETNSEVKGRVNAIKQFDH